MQLQDLQRAFQARGLEGRPGIERELAATASTDFPSRLDVYVQGYRSRLVESLSVTYPVLKALLGEEEFERAMIQFIDAEPSRHYSIRYYGASVAQYVSRGRQGAPAQVLADIAHWEWLLAAVFDAPDDLGAEVAELSAVPAERWPLVSFRFRASVRRTLTRSNALEWWRAQQGIAAAPAEYQSAPPTEWLLWRRDLKTLFRSLSAMEARITDAALDGATFGGLCELIACEIDEAEAPARAASLLRAWFADELIAQVIIPPPT
jgi:hypothetical protein